MKAGRLRHSGEFQTPPTGTDSLGKRSGDWATYATRRISIEPLTGREYFDSAGERSESTHRIRARYDSELAELGPTHRIKTDKGIYNITAIQNYRELDRELIIMCRTDG